MKTRLLFAVYSLLLINYVIAADNCMPKPSTPALLNDRPGYFFAFNISRNAIGKPVEDRLKWAKQAGYTAQHEMGIKNMEKVIQAYDAENMRLSAVYISVDVVKNNLPENLSLAFEAMKKHKPLIWLDFSGAEPSTTDFDDKVVAVVRKVADLAAQYDMQVALYPHSGSYTEKIQDVLRIANKADRKNVGITFNLCHFLKAENGKDFKKMLKEANNKLYAVSICGADVDGKDWSTLIQPLDRGTFNVAQLLEYLNEIKFTGFIGVQDYGIKGEPAETLKRSFDAYQKMIREIKGN